MMPAEPAPLPEWYGCGDLLRLEHRLASKEGGAASSASGEDDDSPDETRLSLETASSSVEAGEGESADGPYVGRRFPTHDAAYEFYCGFARRCGFSIRRHRTEGKDGVGRGLTRRYFVCHRAGSAPSKPLAGAPRPQRNRRSSRCGCQAYMRIGRTALAAAAVAPAGWRVTGFSNHHNHALLGQDQVRLLPAYRVISGPDKDRILMFAKSGISVQQMIRIIELEKSVKPGSLPFTEKDVRNLIHSFRKVDQVEEGSVDLLRMCKNFKEKDPSFKYESTKDPNNCLENIAWTFASSSNSYEMFGDAVVFYTTHRLTALDMALGILVGLNNCGMPCFFGCALLREENQESFAWALQVFLNFMNRKAPRTILTDQNVHLKEAIEKELPSTKHALCIWLIEAKFPCWFSAVLGERYSDWKNEFYRLHNMENTMNFNLGWSDMVNCYGLHGNRQIASLFASRSLWALSYLGGHFSAGLNTSAVSKSILAFIQRFLSAQTCLANFIEQVAVVVAYKDQTGEQEMMQQNLQNISPKTAAPMEGHAATVLTPYAFSKLQDELVASVHHASFHLEGSIFIVRHRSSTEGGCSVAWNQREELISCSCQMFESSGILCRHALRVLSTLNYFQIPDHYLPVRWRRTQPPPSKSLNGAPPHDEGSERVRALQSLVSALVKEAAKSNELMDLATQEVSLLLSRIKEQPVPVHASGENVHKPL
ncbi:protein FAR1-RELATED SEQUENCE 11 [Phragmites australis]|uniref:protein FAR1-RELATED SEQUENCE 11 n=1 Tax=Phragmites australis TaxID=29695 RepID=UPI002D778A4C|nr:protein FAR1-RELATED SEQUENCE 11 [Phragmites australis]